MIVQPVVQRWREREDMIAEAIAAVQQGLPEQGAFLDYVKAVFKSRELVKFIVLVTCGLIGMVCNYAYKWIRDEARGGLYSYMFGSYPRRTLLAIGAVMGWALFMIGTPITEGAGWSALINLGLTTGFAFDSILNKTDKVIWTDAERTAHTNRDPLTIPVPIPGSLPPQG